ncbi:type II secretion system inner membrane protein GspF [Sideroxydans lithotrophicus]|uniref:General secretion pathway protein F n=1 Tax=Sideroxydans lithotrophicus (strain ES-1) TaxID=580332 RepID=D5CMQ1_SIDLE|nr:type II secretion system inner membrane protein GspF [Sideroxydans lithotrophicus]ADE10737.1 general secretion pathway protein F [Sideroxydans lithotrophicus ES-1]
MAAFHYNALDAAGKTSTGMIEADSARLARTQLRDKGLFVVELQSLSESLAPSGTRSWNLPFRKRISLSEVSLMLRQFATLLEAGLPLEQALAVLIEQGDNPAMRQVLATMRSEVLAGNTLARAMEKHRDTFPEIHRALINAGEESGELATVMDRLATYSEGQQALQQKIGLAMIYPAIVVTVAVLVVGGLLIFVVPPVVEVFQQTHQALPFLTRALIGLSDLLSATWLYLIVFFVLGGFGVQRALQQETLRFQLHLKLLRLPIVGKLIRGNNTARMASTLSILVGSGVGLLTALNAACGVVSNLPMRRALEDAAAKVREGATLSRALAASGLFPPVLVHLIASGEQSGRLDTMLDRVAKQQTQEVSGFTSTLASILEPVLILFMGAVVLLIVLAILLPIIQMNQMVK